ncbi:MAG: hypothetical protein KDA57_24230, partial [Planctomycetales bacterium]|nr:hypothetical protein [Planctomycetales bacterium]
WILFKLNDAPVRTEEDGDFNILVLMDAASCYIVATEFVAVRSKELSKKKSLSMLKHGKSHKNELPRRIYVPAELAAHRFIAEAQKEGIACSRAPESELSVFIEEAREGFQEHVGVSRLH